MFSKRHYEYLISDVLFSDVLFADAHARRQAMEAMIEAFSSDPRFNADKFRAYVARYENERKDKPLPRR